MRLILSILPLLAFGQMPLSITAVAGDVNAPGRGAQYWNGVQWNGSDAPQINTGYGYTGYVRLEWDDVEPNKDDYRLTGSFPSLEYWIKHFIDRGQSLAFGGVMTVCDGCGNTAFPDGGRALYPYYLHQMMQAEAVKDWRTSNGYWIPNWNSQAYLSRFQALNDTIARFIDKGSYKSIRYKDVLDWVDIRGYGNFGEWHNYPYYSETPPEARATAQSFINIVNVTLNSFPNTQAIAVANAFTAGGEQLPELGYHILTTQNNYGKIGWRRDNIGGTGDDSYLVNNPTTFNGMRFDTAIVNRWRYAMITGEPLNGDGTCCPLYHDIRREVGLYHYAGFGNGNYGGNSAAVWDTVTKAFAITGYRYELSGSIDSILYSGSPFTVTMSWRNVGAAPMYQKRWRVRYNIVNASGVTVQTFTSKANLYLLMDKSYSETFNLYTQPIGAYNVNVIVEDTTGYFKPLPLMINSRNADGSYTVASVIIRNPSALPIRESDYVRTINNRTEIKVYPNPVASELNVELARNTSKPVIIDIYDVTGRMVMRQTSYAENFKLNTSQLKEGIYIFKLYNRYNIIQKIEKIVKWR